MNIMQMGVDAQAATVEANKIEQLRKMIDAHDLTFQSSDDTWYYKRGQQQYVDIHKYVVTHHISHKEFAAIWNANVDKKIATDWRNDYYLT